MGHYSAVRGEEGEGESLWPWGRQVLSSGDREELPGEKAELRRVRRAWGKSPGGSTGWAGAHGVPAPGRWSQPADLRPSGASQGQSVTQAELGASRASRRLGRAAWTEAKRRSVPRAPSGRTQEPLCDLGGGESPLAGSHPSQK